MGIVLRIRGIVYLCEGPAVVESMEESIAHVHHTPT